MRNELGLIVEIPVPCRDNGEILSREMIRHVRQLAREREIMGIVVNGPTGEAGELDSTARGRVLEIALTAAPQEFPVYVTVRASDDTATEEIETSMTAGAAGVLFECGEGEDLDQHSEALERAAREGRLFIRGGEAALEGAKALDASFTAVGRSAGADQPVLVDDAALVAEGVDGSEAIGGLLSAANVAPEMWAKLFGLLKAGKGDDAETMYRERFAPLTEALVRFAGERDRGAALTVKHALFILAHNVSDASLPPVTKLEEEQATSVAEALTAGRLMGGER